MDNKLRMKEEKLINNGYKVINDIELKNQGDFYINKNGDVVKIITTKKGDSKVKSVPISKGRNGYKISVYIKGKVKTKQIHDLLYKSFKGEYEGSLIYVDGNKFNSNLDNLVSIEELLEVYKNKK